MKLWEKIVQRELVTWVSERDDSNPLGAFNPPTKFLEGSRVHIWLPGSRKQLFSSCLKSENERHFGI